MQRRSFLGTVLSIAGGVVGARPAQARTTVLIQTSPVAGFPYHEGEAVWPSLFSGAALALVREPGNPHDERAVRIDLNGHALGYVPRAENTAVSQLLDRGQTLEAHIRALRKSRDPWKRVEVDVALVI